MKSQVPRTNADMVTKVNKGNAEIERLRSLLKLYKGPTSKTKKRGNSSETTSAGQPLDDMETTTAQLCQVLQLHLQSVRASLSSVVLLLQLHTLGLNTKRPGKVG